MTVKYSGVTLGQIEAIINKLGGEKGASAFLRGELIVIKKVEQQPAALAETIPLEPRDWQAWKSIKIGTGLKTKSQFREALKEAGFKIGGWGNDILEQKAFAATTKEQELELVKTTARELNFPQGATSKEIYDRALDFDLDLCPAEVGLQLRLQYKDQPSDEWLLVAMEPIAGSGRGFGVFYVGCDFDGLWLDASYGHPDSQWGPDDRWVFLRRKS